MEGQEAGTKAEDASSSSSSSSSIGPASKAAATPSRAALTKPSRKSFPLPPGWRLDARPRSTGSTIDYYYHSPKNHVYRSMKAIIEAMKSGAEDGNPEELMKPASKAAPPSKKPAKEGAPAATAKRKTPTTEPAEEEDAKKENQEKDEGSEQAKSIGVAKKQTSRPPPAKKRSKGAQALSAPPREQPPPPPPPGVAPPAPASGPDAAAASVAAPPHPAKSPSKVVSYASPMLHRTSGLLITPMETHCVVEVQGQEALSVTGPFDEGWYRLERSPAARGTQAADDWCMKFKLPSQYSAVAVHNAKRETASAKISFFFPRK